MGLWDRNYPIIMSRRHHLPQEPGGFYRFRNISSTPAKPSLYVWDPRTWELIPPAGDGREGADHTLGSWAKGAGTNLR